jgi:hypothetical protein
VGSEEGNLGRRDFRVGIEGIRYFFSVWSFQKLFRTVKQFVALVIVVLLHARNRLPEQQRICIHIAVEGLVLAEPSNGGENRAFRFACSFYVFCITARRSAKISRRSAASVTKNSPEMQNMQ